MSDINHNFALVKAALKDERSRASSLVKIEEATFLPAALEIVERPVSPTARLTGWLMLGGFAATALWAGFAHLDVVASAPGRIEPGGETKLVQPAASGVVSAILVRDGDRVAAGQPLIALDPTASQAGFEQARAAWQQAALDVARLRMVVRAIDGHGPGFAPPPGVPAELVSVQHRLGQAQIAEIFAATAGYAAQTSAAAAQRAQSGAEAMKMRESLPLLQQQLAANQKLAEKGYVSKLKVLEMQRQLLGAQRDQQIAAAGAGQAGAQLAATASGASMSRAQAKARIMGDLVRAEADEALKRGELVKAEQQAKFQRITSPVAGTVAQLAVHTVGGTVEAGKPIMLVVPDGARPYVAVSIPDRDIGHIRRGQAVAVKLAAFPFTRYGTVPGRIDSIAATAVEDDKLGTVYHARIRLDSATILRDGERVPLTPGLSATADIVTGKRTILSYLMSPIDEAVSEAARER
jgi:hemolysin D